MSDKKKKRPEMDIPEAPQKELIWTNGFEVTIYSKDPDDLPTVLQIPSSGHAESILRGLVHSGYEAMIREADILVEVPKRDRSMEAVHTENSRMPVNPEEYPISGAGHMALGRAYPTNRG